MPKINKPRFNRKGVGWPGFAGKQAGRPDLLLFTRNIPRTPLFVKDYLTVMGGGALTDLLLLIVMITITINRSITRTININTTYINKDRQGG